MRKVRRSGTEPELVVRHLLRGLGLSYRVRNQDLPGSPDLANRRRRWAVFVHGCFWHAHDCRKGTVPQRNVELWERKFSQNRARDARVKDELLKMDYTVVVIWACQLRAPAKVLGVLRRSICSKETR